MKGFRFLTVVFLLSISLPVSASEFLEDDTRKVSSSVRHEVVKAQPLQEGQVTWSYSLGRFFWAGLHAFIHFQNTNTNASYGQPSRGECLVTLRAMNSSLPIDNIWTARHVPQEEDTFTSKYLPRFLGFLREKLLSIPLNLPQIPDDPRALSGLLPILYKKYVPAFENIPEFTRGLETKDILGELVLKGAAGSYIEKVACDKNLYKIDLSFYNQFPVKDGLSRLGAIAWFRYNAATNTMETETIEYRKNPKSILKSYKKAETSPEKWNHKQRIMLATMLNDIGVGRHAADIHFIMASTFSSVNNRYLPTDHPMRSLM